jgi:serine kinase of HPr protein (carbohydrate metabolism regulator)
MPHDIPTVHASAVLAGPRAVLIRGPAGSGKSRLAMALIQAAKSGLLAFGRLIADDRVELIEAHGRLLARAPAGLAGLIEVRGLGICRVDYEPAGVIGLVVDLAAAGAERLPEEAERRTRIAGIVLPRVAVAAAADPLPAVLALVSSSGAGTGDPALRPSSSGRIR